MDTLIIKWIGMWVAFVGSYYSGSAGTYWGNCRIREKLLSAG
jgi:hypothetical protein